MERNSIKNEANNALEFYMNEYNISKENAKIRWNVYLFIFERRT